MSMSLTHRLQILLDDERHERLQALARERGVSVATIVREALDRGLPSPEARRRAAAASLLAVDPTGPGDDPEQLVAELEALRGRHA